MRKVVLAVLLIASFIVPSVGNAATAKAGTTCTKLKVTKVVGAKKFTCIKSGKKLIWDKGVTMPKPIAKKSQVIEIPEIGNRYLKESRISLTAGTTTVGLPVSIVGTGSCSFDSSTSEIILNSLGTCSITASQAGNANYLPAPSITRTFEVLKFAQVINAPDIADQDLLKVKTYNFEFPEVGSESPFVVGSKDASVCSIDGFKVDFLQVGACTLTFNKGGDRFFEASNEATVTFKIFLSAQPGEKGNPAPIGTEVIKGDIAVTIDSVSEAVSSAVCAADTANRSCVDKNGVGVFEPSEEVDRYIEVILSILNNSQKIWIADNLTVQVNESRSYQKNIVYTIDSLDGLELEPGDAISGSYFVLIPADVDSSKATIIYGDGTEAGTFYFKSK